MTPPSPQSGHAVLESARVQMRGATLVFSRLVPSDDGVYICVASNMFGSANHSFTLQTTGQCRTSLHNLHSTLYEYLHSTTAFPTLQTTGQSLQPSLHCSDTH